MSAQRAPRSGENGARNHFLDHPRPLAIAHRGGSLEHEENTLPAFAHAAVLGYSHVETDVHLTRDGEVVIHHDPTLWRMMRDPRAIADLSYGQLRSVQTPGGATAPRLADLLESHPDLFVTIEAKSDTVVAPLIALIQRMGALHRVSIGSFHTARTAQARAALGEALCWSPARRGVLGLWLRSWRMPVPLGPFPVVQVPQQFRGIPLVTPRFVRAAHQRGIQVQVWTVNDAAEMTRLLDMGVDGLMTDRPTLLKEVLITRGDWRGCNA